VAGAGPVFDRLAALGSRQGSARTPMPAAGAGR
jgi:hypothetical protein